MRELSRRQRAAMFAAAHALDMETIRERREQPVRPLMISDYFGVAPLKAGAPHLAQVSPSAALPGKARRSTPSHRFAEPNFPPVRFDDTGFADDCLI